MVFGLCRPKLEDVLDGDDLQSNARSMTPSPPSSPKLGTMRARATSAPTSRRGRSLRRVAPAEPPIAATVSAVVAIQDSGSPPSVAPAPPRAVPVVPEASAAANGGLQENAEETRGPLGPLPSQPANRRLAQKSKPFWELEKGRAPLGQISGRPAPPPSEPLAAGPLKTGGVGEAHAVADKTSARASSEWAVEEFDDGFPSPARPTANGLQRPAMPLSALSASAAAQRAPLAPLAPPKRLVTPAAPASGLTSLASLSELPLLPQQRQPGGARTALPDPKTLPSVLGSVHGGTRHPAAAPASTVPPWSPSSPPTAAPPSSVPVGKSALKGSSSGQGKPAQPGRRLRWTPGEVRRVVVVARPEAVLLAEAKEDYKRNLQAISRLRRQHVHAACGKRRLGGATAVASRLASWGRLSRLQAAPRTRGPMWGLQCGRRCRSCGFQHPGPRHAVPGAGASPRPGGGRRGAGLAPRTRRLPARARGGGRGGVAHVGPDHHASRGGGLLSGGLKLH